MRIYISINVVNSMVDEQVVQEMLYSSRKGKFVNKFNFIFPIKFNFFIT